MRPNAKSISKKTHEPSCPICGSHAVAVILHGVITAEQQQMIDAGDAILSDREEWEGITDWYCKECGCDWSKTQRRFKIPGGVNATRG